MQFVLGLVVMGTAAAGYKVIFTVGDQAAVSVAAVYFFTVADVYFYFKPKNSGLVTLKNVNWLKTPTFEIDSLEVSARRRHGKKLR